MSEDYIVSVEDLFAVPAGEVDSPEAAEQYVLDNIAEGSSVPQQANVVDRADCAPDTSDEDTERQPTPTADTETGTYRIQSVGHDAVGRHYQLVDEGLISSLTINEAEQTVELHGLIPLESATLNLLALERDRMLGYQPDELHMNPRQAVQTALDKLVARGHARDDLVHPDDQQALNL